MVNFRIACQAPIAIGICFQAIPRLPWAPVDSKKRSGQSIFGGLKGGADSEKEWPDANMTTKCVDAALRGRANVYCSRQTAELIVPRKVA